MKPRPSKEDIKKKLQAEQKKWLSIFGTVFSTPEGTQALRYISNLCGWQDSVVGGNPDLGMDVMQGTLHNAARRNVYLELRRLIPARILRDVEFPKEGDE